MARVFALPIKGNQVHRFRRCCVQLSKHRGDLSTMVSAVIDHVLKHLPKRVRLILTAQVLVLYRALHNFWSQFCELLAHLGLKFGPLSAGRVEVRDAVWGLRSLCLFALQSSDPDALGSADMRDGVAH